MARSNSIWQHGGQVQVNALVTQIPGNGWQRIIVGVGGKGPRVCDWARARSSK